MDDAYEYNSNGIDVSHETTTDYNITELVSSTVTSFLENITTPLDPYNETSTSEQWTNFISTISTIEDDSFDNDSYTDTVTDANDECYETICTESDDDFTTPMMTNESPDEMRAAHTTVTTTDPISTNAADKFPSSTVKPKSKKAIKADGCVPYVPKRGDNITGIPPEYVGRELSATIHKMSIGNQQTLRDLCWETLFGQELVKLTVLDLIFTIFATLFVDFFRAVFVRFMNKCWCWDLEKKFPKVGNLKRFRVICIFCFMF